jgi:hypothetical protein
MPSRQCGERLTRIENALAETLNRPNYLKAEVGHRTGLAATVSQTPQTGPHYCFARAKQASIDPPQTLSWDELRESSTCRGSLLHPT